MVFFYIDMCNLASTSVLGISTKLQVMVEPCSIRILALLYSEFLFTFSSYSLVLLITLTIRLGQCNSSDFNSCPRLSINESSCSEILVEGGFHSGDIYVSSILGHFSNYLIVGL